MPKELTSPGLEIGLISEEVFTRELGMCKKLSQKKGEGCNWGECAKCGVIPLLYKLGKGELYEEDEEVQKLRDTVLKSQS